MICHLKIATAGGSRLKETIGQRFKWIREQGYSITLASEQPTDDGEVLDIFLRGERRHRVFRDEDIIYIFKHQLSEIMAEHIVHEWEGRLIGKEVQKSCRSMGSEERQIIYAKSAQFLCRCNDNESLNLLMNYGRKNRIAHRILEHIHVCDLFIVEGFITFCLRDYLTEIRFAVELAMEELKNEKEYNDFITLLRFFVDTQIPRLHEVNVLMDTNGIFDLWDGDGVKIEENYMSYYLDDMLLNEINIDDVLISILITIAPRRIILHNAAGLDSEPVEIIKRVFKDKISLCGGCERCQVHLNNKNTRP